jgi:hypothetical protein
MINPSSTTQQTLQNKPNNPVGAMLVVALHQPIAYQGEHKVRPYEFRGDV